MELLAQIHSVVRWLVLAAGGAAIIVYAISWARRAAFGRVERVLGLVFAGVLDAQAALGLVLLIGLFVRESDLPPTEYILHAAAMFFAVAAAHQTARWRAESDARRLRNGLIAYVLSLALILLGVAVVAQTG